MKRLSAIVLVSLIVLVSCTAKEENKEIEKAIPVRIAKIENKKIGIPIRTSGKLSSEIESKLSFKTGGIVQNIFVEEGESVKRRQILAKLNLGEIKAKVNQAKAAYQKADRDFNRVQELYKDSVATLEQLQNIKTGLEVAKSDFEIANFNLVHSKIIAPSNGRILKRFVEENELIAPGTPVIIFGQSGIAWIMRVGVIDKNVVRIELGNKAKIIIDALPKESFDAEVTEIASAANPFTGTYEVELTIKTKSQKLISGMIASTEIFPNAKGEYKVFPIGALVNADGRRGNIYTPIKNNTIAKKIGIEINDVIDGNVIVEKGLDNIEEVIVEGVEYLTDGEKINVIK